MTREKVAASVSVLDVAQFILQGKGAMTAMKLQKLVYYCQAWSLVWDEGALFSEKILAWANGPVVYELFKLHQGKYQISSIRQGKPEKLNECQKDTINAVLKYYGDRPSQWLSDLTHMESPWKEARKGLPENVRGFKEITLASLHDYYGSLSKKSATT